MKMRMDVLTTHLRKAPSLRLTSEGWLLSRRTENDKAKSGYPRGINRTRRSCKRERSCAGADGWPSRPPENGMVASEEAHATKSASGTPEAGRQRSGCSGGRRLRARGDVAGAFGQPRRRRLHADPARGRQRRDGDRLSRDAPELATREMFLDEKGKPDPQLSRYSGFAVGVPGTVAGLALAHWKYGSGKLTSRSDRAGDPARARWLRDRREARLFAWTGPEAIRALRGLGGDLPQAG